MAANNLGITGLLVYTPKKFSDYRGSFSESFNLKLFTELSGLSPQFVQDNESISKKNVLRGLHFQIPPHAQGKLVRVVAGSALDVAVDLRMGSATYGKHAKVLLSASEGNVFWIPPGFAHGFLSLTDETIFQYKCTNYYHQASEKSIVWNDSALNIDWRITAPVLSPKDAEGVKFVDFISPF